MSLRLQCRSVRNSVVVYCRGKIVFGKEAKLLFNQVAALLAKRRQVVLHLGGVETIDAAGLGTVAQLAALARSSGSELKVCNLPEHIASLLDLTHLSQMLTLYATEEEALAASNDSLPDISSVPAVA